MKNELREAILRLTKLGPFWALLADTQPRQFLDQVTDEIIHLREEVATLKAELEKLRGSTWCLYCGAEFSLDSSGEQLEAHILECAKHPVGRLMRENRRLLEEGKRLRREYAVLQAAREADQRLALRRQDDHTPA